MTNKYEIFKEVYIRIGDARTGVATSGTTTTLTDNNLSEPDEYYNGGSLLLDTDPPVGKQIIDWDAASHTFTFSTLGSAITAGTSYVAVSPKYPLDVIGMCVEQALNEIGSYPEILEVTSSGEYSYSVSGMRDIKAVEYSEDDGDTWKKHLFWKVVRGRLEFLKEPPESNYKIRIHYMVRHEVLSNWDSLLNEKVDPTMVVIFACRNALLWRNYKVGTDEPNTTELLNYYLRECDKAKARMKNLYRDPTLAIW